MLGARTAGGTTPFGALLSIALLAAICYFLIAWNVAVSIQRLHIGDVEKPKSQIHEIAEREVDDDEVRLSLAKLEKSLDCSNVDECLSKIDLLKKHFIKPHSEGRLRDTFFGMEMNQRRKSVHLWRQGMWSFTSRHSQFKKDFDITPDMVNCKLPLLLFVGGEGNQGKTAMANELKNQGRVQVLHLDQIFMQYRRTKGEKEIEIDELGLGEAFKKNYSSKAKLLEFGQYIAGWARKEMQRSPLDIVIFDGYYLSSGLEKEIHSALDTNLDALSLVISRGAVYMNNHVIVDAALRYPAVQSILFKANEEEWKQTSAQLGAHNLMTFIQHIYAEHLSKHTSYQCYEEVGMDCKNSLSSKNFEKLNAPIFAGKRVLDVGCNTGYFPTHYAIMDPPPKEVVGIDFDEDAITKAQCYSSMIMGTARLTSFVQRGFLDHNTSSYDVITCTSAFHYFMDQQAFMDHAQSLLNNSGMLILEIGISTKNQGTPFTEKYARTSKEIGQEPRFPNIEEMRALSSSYKLVYWGPSVRQRGDALSRMVFHFSLYPGARAVAFPTYSDVIKSDFPEGCTAACYLENHKDLRKAFGQNEDLAREHYQKHGIAEGRDCTCKSNNK